MVSGVVLAAGMSRRLGQPKQLVRVNGKTLIEIALDTALRSRLADVTVVISPEMLETVRSAATNSVHVVVNEHARRGQSSSLRLGIKAVPCESRAAIVLMVDQPLVTPAILDKLVETWEETQPLAVVPMYAGIRGTPALLSRSLFAQISELEGDIGAREILRRNADCVAKVEVGHLGRPLDIDTPEDLQQLKGEMEHWQSTVSNADSG